MYLVISVLIAAIGVLLFALAKKIAGASKTLLICLRTISGILVVLGATTLYMLLSGEITLPLSVSGNLPDQLISSVDTSKQGEFSLESPPNITVEFVDPVIEEAIRELLQKPNGNISEDELLSITVLGDIDRNGGAFGDLNGEITTLSDLKWLKNLTTLSLGDCGIESLVGIENLENLEILRLRRNHITDLEPLLNLIKLKELDLSENPINDTSALCNLVNMESLGLGDCTNINLSPVSGMSKLKRLYASYSNITDISMLEDKIDLEYLQLFHNNISDISSLKELTNLTYLNLSLNNISNIDVLEGLPNLETVQIRDNPIPEEALTAFLAPKEQDFFTKTIRQQIGNTDYIFELLAYKDKDRSQYQTSKITLKNAESGTVIQEITPSEYTYFKDNPSYFDRGLGFVIEDMNFDGYADIRIVEFLPAGPNIPYTCWVWDNKINQYVFHPALSAITSLEIDYDNKLIYNFGRSSASEHFETYYGYINGELLQVKEVRTGFLDETDPNQGYSITHELIDGQWIITQKEKIRIIG